MANRVLTEESRPVLIAARIEDNPYGVTVTVHLTVSIDIDPPAKPWIN